MDSYQADITHLSRADYIRHLDELMLTLLIMSGKKPNPKKHRAARRKRGKISIPAELVSMPYWFDGANYIQLHKVTHKEAEARKLILRHQTIFKHKQAV